MAPRTEFPAETELPVLPLRSLVLFPHAALPITVSRPSVLGAVEAVGEDGLVAVITQLDPEEDRPSASELYKIGTGAIVRQLTHLGDGGEAAMMVLEGLERIAIVDELQAEPYPRVRVRRLASELGGTRDTVYTALHRNVLDLFEDVVKGSPSLPDDLVVLARNIPDDSALADVVASALVEVAASSRQALLASLDVRRRMERLVEILIRERESLLVGERIRDQVAQKIAGTQREFILREQLKTIRQELGDEQGEEQELDELRGRIDESDLPDEARAEAERELRRLQHIPPGSPEHSMVRTYLDWLAALPWNRTSATVADLDRSAAILDEDHYDLEKVKERILEHLAVQQLKQELKGPILCFVGPPGVGKTSVGRSIARATGREFVRLSLGGTHDEAEIRGHRRTYVGALPGQIIRGLRRAGTSDPVFMLDEIDKLGKDFRGDPSSALLEVLDPEQNFAFRDHYLDVPFDLSRVFFIATANLMDPIPAALHDRMEVIELPGYIDEEKLEIALRYLIPKQIEAHGLSPERHIRFEPDAIASVIRSHTHEAGVRKLEQHVAAICRKRARQVVRGEGRGEGSRLTVTQAVVGEMLGAPRHRIESQLEERTQRPGVAVALAWTPYGGDVLFVESTHMPGGKGDFTLTGQLGDVMQESARTALSWLRAHAAEVGIEERAFRSHDIHVHVPSGAVPKDGPSAGVVMAVSLASLLTDRPVRPFVAMTGEITLSGVLLPIGGLKEKVLAARRSGVHELILPSDNRPNLIEEVPEHLREGIEVHYATTIAQAIDLAIAGRQPAARLGPARPRGRLTARRPSRQSPL
jgi:ATP-dependent Lon protease